jgi:hypothetical protein
MVMSETRQVQGSRDGSNYATAMMTIMIVIVIVLMVVIVPMIVRMVTVLVFVYLGHRNPHIESVSTRIGGLRRIYKTRIISLFCEIGYIEVTN